MWKAEKSHRMNIMISIIVAIFIILISRLAWMQLVNGTQYKKIEEENRIRQITPQVLRVVDGSISTAPMVWKNIAYYFGTRK